ncbi:MAG TPA: hypothetical protein DE179_13530 [Oceanospirillaceae bacterium]|nr:hypothetical protein [Oceanospirillaceae bacterium]
MRFQTVKAKLIIGFGVILVLSSIAGFVSLSSMSEMNDRAKSLVHDSVAQVSLAQTAKQLLSSILETEKKVLLVNDDGAKQALVVNLKGDVAALDSVLFELKVKEGLVNEAPAQEGLTDTAQLAGTDVQAVDEQAKQGSELPRADNIPLAGGEQAQLHPHGLAAQELTQLSQVWQDYKVLNQQVLAYSELNSNVKAQALSRDGSRRAYDALQVILTEEISLADEKRTLSSADLVQAQSNLKLALGVNAAFTDMAIKVRDYLANGKGSWKRLKSDLKRLDKKVQNVAKSEANMKMFVNAIVKIWSDTYAVAQIATDGDVFLLAYLPKLDKLTKISRQLANSNAGSVASGNSAKVQSDERLLIINRIRRNLMEAQLNERALVASQAVFEMQLAVENVDVIELDVRDDLDILKTLISFTVVQAIDEALADYLDVFYQVAEINMENGNVNAFNLVQTEGEQIAAQAMLIMDRLIEVETLAMQEQVASSEQAYSNGRLFVVALLVGSLMIGVVLAISLVRSLNTGLSRLVGTAKRVQTTGDFTLRTKLQRSDELGQVGDAFDSLLGELQSAIDAANKVLAAVAKGDFNERIKVDFKGDLGTLKSGVNSSAESVNYTMHALQDVMGALARFDFSARVSDQVSGELKVQVDSSMAAMQLAVAEIQQVMRQVSEGRFESRIESDLSGEMGELKHSINVSLDQLQTAINETSSAMGYQAEGDLSTRMEGEYQGTLADLKASFNNSSANLGSTLSMVSETSSSVAEMANKMASASDDISDRIQAQASSLEQTAASMEELTSTVVENAEHAEQAQALTQTAVNTSQETNAIVTQAVAAMDQISQSSQQMADIIELIDSIAFQTNLLALNASVEAARAGEQGRGFAVVAGEVRILSQKTADASKDIKELIEVNIERIQRGSNFVGQSGEAMQEINRAMEEVADFVQSIARASVEQRTSIQQVSEAVNSMDNLTQQNAVSVDQAADTSKMLNTEAKDLQQQVGQFKI